MTKTTKIALIAGALASLLACCGLGTVVSLADGAPKAGQVRPSSAPPTGQQPPSPRASASYHQPKPSDFTLTVKILEKKCFGSAGCSVTYRVDLNGGGNLDPGKTYELTYEVRGLEDTAIGTMEITGLTYNHRDKEFGSTTSSAKKLTAVVTSVTEIG